MNFVEGLIKEEVTAYQDANPDFVPLFEIEVLELISSPPPPTPLLALSEGAGPLSHEVAAKLEMATTVIRAELTKSERV